MQPPHGRHLRIGRRSLRNHVYLCTATTHLRQRLFMDLKLGRIVVNEFRVSDLRGMTETLAFVVMPDHFHWLFRLRGQIGLSEVLRRVKNFSSRRITRESGCPRPVWQAGFHDHCVRSEEVLRRVARYVIANPLRAGLVESIRDYPLWDAVWL
jgi:REP element-mobilizing transposase RayT